MVVFSASQTGTFAVHCDLHPAEVGKLTVFDGAALPTGPVSPRQRQALTLALSRNLGSVDYPGTSGVLVDATYAPAEYVTQALGGAAAMAALQPDRHIAVMLTERTHTANLPVITQLPDLFVGGRRVPLVDRKVMTDSVHHRATFYRFARDDAFGKGHQVMTLRLASGQEATWHLPLIVPSVGGGDRAPVGLGEQWGLIFALMGGMVAAMWPCLFQLTVYFIPALAGIAMQEAGGQSTRSHRRQVLVAAFYFILGFTLVYTATGAVIGLAAQRLGDTAQFDVWQRYLGVGAGIVVIGLALRVAAKVRAPLICKMPILSGMANSKTPATRLEMMLAGLAFATGCMTCFGSALVVGMVVYIGLAQSALYGALVLFLFSLGMGIPLVIAALAMARALPLLLKLERAVPWMGLASATLMAGFGILLISGNYMVVSEWTFRAMDTFAGR
jgi:cytochrome c-type biogenesis protein